MAILTVSRQVGSGGREIGQAVAGSLNYSMIEKATVLNDLREIGKEWEQCGQDFDERSPSILEKYNWAFRGVQALIQSIILDYAARDRVVIVGRGGNFLLNDVPYVLSIRVVAPLEERVERVMRRESIDRATARWLTKKADKVSRGFIKALFGKSVDDPGAYDFIFDTSAQPPATVIPIVEEALSAKEKHNTEEARNALRTRAIAAKLEAGLVTDPRFSFFPTLNACAEGNSLVVRGVVRNPDDCKRVENAARELVGDLPLRVELRCRL